MKLIYDTQQAVRVIHTNSVLEGSLYSQTPHTTTQNVKPTMKVVAYGRWSIKSI